MKAKTDPMDSSKLFPFSSQPTDVSLEASVASSPADYSRLDSFLDVVIDTLQQLTAGAQGRFLQKFLNGMAGVNLSEKDSLTHWEGILRRRTELSQRLGRPVKLMTAVADYFGTTLASRNPVQLEYEELKLLRQNAGRDTVTGLLTRKLFEEQLSKEVYRARRYSLSLSGLLFDIRNLDAAIEAQGYSVGHEILRGFARACAESIRGSDHAFRIGEDQFALLLPQAEGPGAEGVALRILPRFEEYTSRLAPTVGLGLDYGLAAFPKDAERAEKLLEAASRALQLHKQEADQSQSAASEVSAGQTQAGEATGQRRRYNRVSMRGSDARGIIPAEADGKEVQVLDMGLGGVSFLIEADTQIPEIFRARLRVPPFQDVDLEFRRVYVRSLTEGLVRLGCLFTHQ